MATSREDDVEDDVANEHRKIFRNLCRRFDINQKTVNFLKEEHQISSYPSLEDLTEEEIESIVIQLTLGQRSCLRGAVNDLKTHSLRMRASVSLPANLDNCGDQIPDSVPDHELDFKRFCQLHNINEDIIQVLKLNDCCSIPALKYINPTEAKYLLVMELKTVGQRAILETAIGQLQGLPRPTSEPNLPSMTCNQPDNQDIPDLEQKMWNIHCQIPIKLDITEKRSYFKDIATAAQAYLHPGEIDGCENITDLWKVMEKKGCIKLGKYDILLQVFTDIKLPRLKKVVETEKQKIEDIRKTRATFPGEFMDVHGIPQRKVSGPQPSKAPNKSSELKPRSVGKPVQVSDANKQRSNTELSENLSVSLCTGYPYLVAKSNYIQNRITRECMSQCHQAQHGPLPSSDSNHSNQRANMTDLVGNTKSLRISTPQIVASDPDMGTEIQPSEVHPTVTFCLYEEVLQECAEPILSSCSGNISARNTQVFDDPSPLQTKHAPLTPNKNSSNDQSSLEKLANNTASLGTNRSLTKDGDNSDRIDTSYSENLGTPDTTDATNTDNPADLDTDRTPARNDTISTSDTGTSSMHSGMATTHDIPRADTLTEEITNMATTDAVKPQVTDSSGEFAPGEMHMHRE